MITGSSIAVGRIIIHRINHGFPINGLKFWALAMGGSSLVYVLVSLLGKRKSFDLDRMLHRGAHALQSESRIVERISTRGFKILGMGREFAKGDRAIYVATYLWIFLWTAIFIAGTVYNLSHDVDDSAWARFWQVYLYIQIAMSVLVVIWFTIGGFRDIRIMLRRLKVMERDQEDDGRILSSGGD